MTRPDVVPRPERFFLVISHMARTEALRAASVVCHQLSAAGAIPALLPEQWDAIHRSDPDLNGSTARLGSDVSLQQIELVVVLGGDGTILAAAEHTRGAVAPLLGVNLGHVGFLAESEHDDLGYAVARTLARDYVVEERMTIAVQVEHGDDVVYTSWALNEAAVEKAARERMLEVVIEVDGRPLSSFGCDGVVLSTATGSTAYAFSGGGPVVWPSLDAMLLVPLAAHSLFARPLVVGPDSSLAVELVRGSGQQDGVLWCDGRRSVALPAGARVVARRSTVPVRLARLHRAPFTDRLVNKFRLPVKGWRGPVGRD